MRLLWKLLCGLVLFTAPLPTLRGATTLTEMPAYSWHAGCFGTACGNLMGYWDRHGMADFYTGPTAGGVAPLDDSGSHVGIQAMWASRAGLDGRPANKLGHIDDYWNSYVGEPGSYESTLSDPYALLGRAEHTPDCIGDFLGLSQKKWTNMNGECDGNIDAYGFNYWDTRGIKRVNYVPPPQGAVAVKDIQSGLRAWTRFRGYDCEVVSQLADINPECPAGKGFTFEDLKAELNAGYPVLLQLQAPFNYSTARANTTSMPRANPGIHGVLAFGYDEWSDGVGGTIPKVQVMFSWGAYAPIETWSSDAWLPDNDVNLGVRGVICYHPRPKLKTASLKNGTMTLSWDGPSAQLYDDSTGVTTSAHFYQVQWSPTLNPPRFSPVGPVVATLGVAVPVAAGGSGFYRVSLLSR